MSKSISYCREGDYLLPNLVLPKSAPVGIWGQRRQDYLRRNKGPVYTGLLLSGKLDAHLAEVDQSATELYERLLAQMAQAEEISEELKATDQMGWVGRMNNLCNRVAEVVLNELIYI